MDPLAVKSLPSNRNGAAKITGFATQPVILQQTQDWRWRYSPRSRIRIPAKPDDFCSIIGSAAPELLLARRMARML